MNKEVKANARRLPFCVKLKVAAEALLAGLQVVRRVIRPRNTLPILSGVHMQAGEALVLTGGDLENWCTVTVPVEVAETGTAVLPAAKLFEIIRTLDGNISVAVEGSQTVINYSQGQAKLSGFAPDEYPIPPIVEGIKTVRFTPDELACMSKVLHAVALEDVRPVFTGVYIVAREGRLQAVGTDTYRLAVAETNTELGDLELVIPAHSVKNMIYAAGFGDGLDVAVDGSYISFKAGNVEMKSKLLAGEFPEWERLIPTKFECEFTASAAEISGAISRAAILAAGNTPVVTVKVDNDEVKIITSSDSGACNETIAPSKSKGAVEVSFNANYLLEGLKGFEQVEVKLSGSRGPTVLTAAEATIKELVLPVIVNQ